MSTSPRPFVVAGAVAAAPLLALAAAAPGGDSWVWLEYPRRITLVAFFLGVSLCFVRERYKALLVLAGTMLFALGAELLDHGSRWRVEEAVARAAPWLVGGIYSVLALLSISRASRACANRQRAGLWLVVVGVVALLLTLANRSWLTLENLTQQGTFRSSVAWPDTKKVSLALDLVAIAVGIALLVQPRLRDRIPRATLQR